MLMRMEHALTIGIVLMAIGTKTLIAQPERRLTLHGRVSDEESDKPVPMARAQLSGPQLLTPLIAQTDEKGDFSFAVSPMTGYRLRIEKAGYLNYDEPREILVENDDISLGEIRLVGKRAISGSVRWRNGDPAGRALVIPLRTRGGQIGTPLRPVVTDDRGQYRITDLPPGRYSLFATVQGELSPSVRSRTAVPVFYPGSAKPEASAVIDLRHVREPAAPIILTLEDSEGVSISGMVEPTEISPNGTEVVVSLIIPDIPAQPIVQRSAKAGERFTLPGVPPGNYSLLIYTPGKPEDTKVSAVPLVVSTSPIENLRVSVPRATGIKGVIKIEGVNDGSQQSKQPPSASSVSLSGVRIIATLKKYPYWPARPVKAPDMNGNFELGGVFRGETYFLELQNLPSGFYVASVRQTGNRELAGEQLAVIPSDDGGPVNIVLKNDGGSISGVVMRNGRPVSRAFVVLAPQQRDALHRYRVANAASDGTYKLSTVPPGRYNLLALDQNYDDDFLDPMFLEKQNDRMRVIDVSRESSPSFNLELIETN